MEQKNILLDRITVCEDLMGGKPTIRGMRFPVQDIVELWNSGMTDAEILCEHPSLEKEDLDAVKIYKNL